MGKRMKDYENSVQQKRVLHNDLNLAMEALGMDQKNIMKLESYVESFGRDGKKGSFTLSKDEEHGIGSTPTSEESFLNDEKSIKDIRKQIDQIQSEKDMALRSIKEKLDEKIKALSSLRIENDILRNRMQSLDKKHKEELDEVFVKSKGLEDNYNNLMSAKKEIEGNYESVIEERDFHLQQCELLQEKHTETVKEL